MKKGTLMRTKIYALGLACILLISCGKKAPSGPILPHPAPNPPKIVYFTANPLTIKLGEKSTLSWEVTDCTSVEIDGGIGLVSGTGSIEVSPLVTTVYTLTAKNTHYEDLSKTYGYAFGGSVTKDCTVTVKK